MNHKELGKKGVLILENGLQFEGKLIGHNSSVSGEVVFNTGMVGYPETFTDPSYKGQIQCITYPLVGNYGVPEKDPLPFETTFESDKIHLNGIIISDYSTEFSHSTAIRSLSSWLKEQQVPGLYDIDTRKLTKILREQGTMRGKIIASEKDVPFTNLETVNLVEQVSPEKTEEYGTHNKKVLLVDCGCKSSIISSLLHKNIKVIRVPWDADLSQFEYDGVLFSNGPGNPEACKQLVESAKKVITSGKPVLGICLGHQIIALAAGAEVYKLKYGHRGQNQPVKEFNSERCYITSQNHGYAVDTSSLSDEWEDWFVNLNDDTNEGLRHKTLPVMTVQFHPEAAPGPVDTTFIFDEFIKMMEEK